MRVAAAGLGSNSMRLLVADVREGQVDEGRTVAAVPRVWADASGRLLLLPMGRVRNIPHRLPPAGGGPQW